MNLKKLFLASAISLVAGVALAAVPSPVASPAPVATVRPTAHYSLKITRGNTLEGQLRLVSSLGNPISSSTGHEASSHCSFANLFGAKSDLKFSISDGITATIVPQTMSGKQVTAVVSVSVAKTAMRAPASIGGCQVVPGQGSNEYVTDVVTLQEGASHMYKLDGGVSLELKLDKIQTQNTPIPQ